MNHKELVREMREMHKETLQQLKLLTDVLQKLALSGIAVQSSEGILVEPKKSSVVEPAGIQMDESTYVTEVKTDSLEKSFTELAEKSSTEDKQLKSGLSKLRQLKKGD